MKKRFKIDKKTWVKVGKGLLIALAAGVLTYIEGLAGMPDLGEFGVIIQYGVNAGLINLGRKFIAKY